MTHRTTEFITGLLIYHENVTFEICVTEEEEKPNGNYLASFDHTNCRKEIQQETSWEETQY